MDLGRLRRRNAHLWMYKRLEPELVRWDKHVSSWLERSEAPGSRSFVKYEGDET